MFILINGTYSIKLLLERYRKVPLDPLEERIFEADFKRVMDRRTFKRFIGKGYLRTFADGGQIVHKGNNFSSIYYVALINPNYRVQYS